MESIYVTAPFPLELEHQARVAAAMQRVSRSELIRLAVVAYLEKLKIEPAAAGAQIAKPEAVRGV